MLEARRQSLSRAQGGVGMRVLLQGGTAGDTSALGHCSWLQQSRARGSQPLGDGFPG